MWEFITNIDWSDVAALIVAFAAMYIASQSLKQNQQHHRLSVRPWITGHYRTQEDSELSLEIENRGLGPAVIKTWEFWHESRPVQKTETARAESLEDVINLAMPSSAVQFTYRSRKRGSILKSGETWKVFELRASKSSPSEMAAVKSAMQGFCMDIHYESLYGEPFSESVSRWKRNGV